MNQSEMNFLAFAIERLDASIRAGREQLAATVILIMANR
jgi:hypothetical protein